MKCQLTDEAFDLVPKLLLGNAQPRSSASDDAARSVRLKQSFEKAGPQAGTWEPDSNVAPRSAAKFNEVLSPQVPAKPSVVETSMAEAETIKP